MRIQLALSPGNLEGYSTFESPDSDYKALAEAGDTRARPSIPSSDQGTRAARAAARSRSRTGPHARQERLPRTRRSRRPA